MRVSPNLPALAVALSLALTACSRPDAPGPAAASAPPRGPASEGLSISGAEKLLRLDIMLMVTALRCRTTRTDFTPDYHRFAARHRVSLNQAGAQLRGQLAARHGEKGGKQAFDRLSTAMANGYGGGHPWLDCAQLRQVARNLAGVEGRPTLEEAADQVLSRRGSGRLALGKR